MLTLFRYYLRAGGMFEQFRRHRDIANAKFGQDWSRHVATSEVFDVWMYLDYWLAGLRAVVEGYNKLALSYPPVDALLKSDHLPKLNDYRHGVAHFRETFFDPNQHRLAAEEGGIEWARDLHDALGDGIRVDVARRSAALKASGKKPNPPWPDQVDQT